MTPSNKSTHSDKKAAASDPNSASNFNDYHATRLSLDWTVDFERKVIRGHVGITFRTINPAPKIVLDGAGLAIQAVSDVGSGGAPLGFAVSEGRFGDVISIDAPPSSSSAGSEFGIRIDYETTAKCSAVQWLNPEQTAGGKHPYLFTQCQAIHARSMLPCQDTPAVKSVYEARVCVPSPLSVVMSANKRVEKPGAGGCPRVFEFAQTVPIPAYLIAMGVGDLHSVSIGPRSTLWSERELLDRGSWEFADTESFIRTAEQLTTPYEWGVYDILLLPPSFPYGGMENPCLTFLTPSLLAGDRSLVDVVAHEISHSWTGNLVTNANWEHFWLNEGFTMFLERKILGRLHGEAHRHLDAIVGLGSLRDSIAQFPPGSPATQLVVDLSGTSPDDVYSTVPYEKGHTLLAYLEQLVGGAAAFEPYLAAHIRRFAGHSLETAEWKAFLLDFFASDAVATRKLAAVDWQAWLYGAGMPPVIPAYDDTLVRPCKELAASFIERQASKEPNSTALNAFSLQQKLVFLDTLIDAKDRLDIDVLRQIDARYSLSASTNVEICLKWYMLSLHLKDASVFGPVARYITSHGRMKYNRPLYRLLAACSEKGRQVAEETFRKHRSFYHPIAVQMISKDLGLSDLAS